MQSLFEIIEEADKVEGQIETSLLENILSEAKKAKINLEFLSVEAKKDIQKAVNAKQFGAYFFPLEKLKSKLLNYEQKVILVKIKDTLFDVRDRLLSKSNKLQIDHEISFEEKMNAVEKELKLMSENHSKKIVGNSSKNIDEISEVIHKAVVEVIDSTSISDKISTMNKEIAEINRSLSLDVTIKRQKAIGEDVLKALSEIQNLSVKFESIELLKIVDRLNALSNQMRNVLEVESSIKSFVEEKLKFQNEKICGQFEYEVSALKDDICELKEIKEDIDTLPTIINGIDRKLSELEKYNCKTSNFSATNTSGSTAQMPVRKRAFIDLCNFMTDGMDQLALLSDSYFDLEENQKDAIKDAESRGANNALKSLVSKLEKECPEQLEKIMVHFPENIVSTMTS